MDVFHSTLCKAYGAKVEDMDKSGKDDFDDDDTMSAAGAAASQ